MAADAGWVRGLPKAEVHVHLEGSLPPPLVVGAGDPAFRDLGGFLAYLDAACRLVTTAEQVAAAGYAVAARAAAAGVRYVDLIWNPTHWPAWHDRAGAFIDALDSGLRAASGSIHSRFRLAPAALVRRLPRTLPSGFMFGTM